MKLFFSDTFTPSERTFLTNNIVTQENSPKLRSANLEQNPLIGYLNINSLRNKIIDVREAIGKLSLDYFVISETRLDESFLPAQFNISNYETRNRRDRDKNGGGLIEFVRKVFITKRLKDYET